ncbi:MAG: protein arginine kinase [Gemmatimonadota bacterium]
MKLQAMIQAAPSWLSGSDDADGIVVSCRARLARNLASHPFSAKATPADRERVVTEVLGAAKQSRQMGTASFYSMDMLDSNDRRVLVERHLISPALADSGGHSGVLFNRDESLSVMINEEDHLRLQAMCPGRRAGVAWSAASVLDDELNAAVACAYDEHLGYLTACPTNTGTGLRMSVLIHLPALVLTEDVERVIQGLNQLSFAVRGVYGEGTNAAGNLFQVSNQVTLGRPEGQLVEDLTRITRQLVEYERDAQEALLADARSQVEDKVWRAYGLLAHARVLSSQEFMNLLSALRLGVSVGFVKQIPTGFLNHLMIVTQPSHLQARAGGHLEPQERDLQRAELVRRRMAEVAAQA